MKPILFNTEMVRKVLSGEKTVTRRVVKPSSLLVLGSQYHKDHPEVPDNQLIEKLCSPPYWVRETLYVRETWNYGGPLDDNDQPVNLQYYYAADGDPFDRWLNDDGTMHEGMKWRPSIHMPKEAARIFLRVTDVRAERLQEITDDGARAEGIGEFFIGMGESGFAVRHDSKTFYEGPIGAFVELWDSTVAPEKRDTYGWAANPWVWVIEFERCEKPKEE